MAAYATGNYEFASDAGTNSISALTQLADSSGVPFTVTSAYRNEANSWHSQYNAIDMSSTQADMTQLANYLLQYHEFLLELIHTNADGSGAYVKNGVIVDADYYGAVTVSEHRDHVHMAGTLSAMVAAEKATSQAEMADTQIDTSGCGKQAAAGLLLVIGGGVWLVQMVSLLVHLVS